MGLIVIFIVTALTMKTVNPLKWGVPVFFIALFLSIVITSIEYTSFHDPLNGLVDFVHIQQGSSRLDIPIRLIEKSN